MNKFFQFPLCLALLLGCFVTSTAHALTPVEYSSVDAFGAAFTNKVMLQPHATTNTILISGTNFVIGRPVILYPGTNGYVTTNLVPNTYRMSVDGITRTWLVAIPDTNTTQNLTDLVLDGTVGTYTYTNNAAFRVKATSGDSTPGVLSAKLLPGDNVTFTTNSPSGNATITISATGGGGGATNAVSQLNGLSNSVVMLAETNQGSAFGFALSTNSQTLTFTFTINTNLLTPAQVYAMGSAVTNYADALAQNNTNYTDAAVAAMSNYVASAYVGTNQFAATNSALQTQIDGKLSSVNASNVLYVAKDGSDLTGTRGRQDKPFATLTAANSAASAGDTILVLPGTYTETNSIALKAVTLTGMGATLQATNLTDVFLITTNANTTIENLKITCNTAGIGVWSTSSVLGITNMTLRNLDIYGDLSAVAFAYSGSSPNFALPHDVVLSAFHCKFTTDTTLAPGPVALLLGLSSNSVVKLFNCDTYGAIDGVLAGGSTNAQVNIFGGVYFSTLDAITSSGAAITVIGARARGEQSDINLDGGNVYLYNVDYVTTQGNTNYFFGTNRAPELVVERAITLNGSRITSWPSGGSGSGETNTASNLGGGYHIYDSKSGVDLRFNTITNDATTSVTSNANLFTIGISSLWQNKILTNAENIVIVSNQIPAMGAAISNSVVTSLNGSVGAQTLQEGSGIIITDDDTYHEIAFDTTLLEPYQTGSANLTNWSALTTNQYYQIESNRLAIVDHETRISDLENGAVDTNSFIASNNGRGTNTVLTNVTAIVFSDPSVNIDSDGKASLTWVKSQTAPTGADNLTRKDYVDATVAAAGLAGTNYVDRLTATNHLAAMTNVDLLKIRGDYVATGSFTVTGLTNVSASSAQYALRYITNSAATNIVLTLPSGWKSPVSTNRTFTITNATTWILSIDLYPGFTTNFACKPLL